MIFFGILRNCGFKHFIFVFIWISFYFCFLFSLMIFLIILLKYAYYGMSGIPMFVESLSYMEICLKFVNNENHKVEIMFNRLKDCLKEVNVTIKDCRSQFNDNAFEKYIRVQALVSKENSLAIWIPCIGRILSMHVYSSSTR